MVKNAYIHIPFCKSKCRYCSFISYSQLDKKEEYLAALSSEIKHFYKGENLNTLYIGGGTPSLLEVREIKDIIDMFEIEHNAEVTVELNPENLDRKYLCELRKSGVNRISIGCQTFDDDILKLIGRRHGSYEVKNAVKLAKDCGFENISLDFIYGLPTQTEKGFISDLKTAVGLGICHISLYGLKIDEGCYFCSNLPENLPDDDMQADMYLQAIETLENADFEHYEISNFAQKGYSSRHNLNYWDNKPYYGFGIAAHGYVDGIRYSNFCDFANYLKTPLIHANEHRLNVTEKFEEEIFLGFRRLAGIDVDLINKKFDVDFNCQYRHVLEKYESGGFVQKTCNGWKLTNSGILVSNTILAEFLQ